MIKDKVEVSEVCEWLLKHFNHSLLVQPLSFICQACLLYPKRVSKASLPLSLPFLKVPLIMSCHSS